MKAKQYIPFCTYLTLARQIYLLSLEIGIVQMPSLKRPFDLPLQYSGYDVFIEINRTWNRMSIIWITGQRDQTQSLTDISDSVKMDTEPMQSLLFLKQSLQYPI